MNYHVCVQNCFEDFHYDNAYCGKFDTKESALQFVESVDFHPPVFDVHGYIKWFFPSCDSDGILKNPTEDDDVLECYQLINIIPCAEDETWIDETYGNDPRAVYIEMRYYKLWYTGEYEFL